MKVQQVKELLNATYVTGEEFSDKSLHSACGSDMMSDVLAFVKDQAVLLTGLVNPQVIRTAEMMDMVCIVFVRGKRPDETMINLAKARDMVLLTTELEMFSSCGILYQNGLRGRSHVNE